MLCMYMQWDLQHHAHMHPCMHACMLCIDPVTRSCSRDKLLAHLLASQQQLISMESGFTVETAIVVSGGDLDTPQLLKYERVGGACLFKLAKHDRTLARIVGQITHRGKRLFDGVDVFDFVRDLRNTTIDKAINERARAEDPMAEDIPDAESSGRARSEQWKGDALIDLHLPGFKTSSGHEHAAITARVLATTMKSASVMIDLTGPVLEWLKHACTITWMDDAESPPRDNKRKADDTAFEFPGVQWPENVNIIVNNAKSLRIGSSYKDKDGKWTKFTRSIKKDAFDSADELGAAVSSMVRSVSVYYHKHHKVESESDAPDQA